MNHKQESVRIGIDMGGNDIKFGATNPDATQVLLPELIKRPSLTKDGPKRTVGQMIDGIQAVLDKVGAAWAQVIDISVTVPCPCSPEGMIIEATNLGTPETKDLWKVPFGELLAEAVEAEAGIAIPVFACNDANAAGQDDDFVRYGNQVSRRTSVFITTGTGLGGCVIVDGNVFFGVGQAGEFGHVKPAVPAAYAPRFGGDSNPPCGCNGHQCVEARASLRGLVRRIEWALSMDGVEHIGQQLLARGEELNQEVVNQLRTHCNESPQRASYEVRTFADRDKDPFCRWLLEDWAIMIGVLFANLAPVLHPNLFVIGGGMTEMSPESRDWFIGTVRRVYGEVNMQKCFDLVPGSCDIEWSASQDQGWRGAILMSHRSRR